MTVFREETYGTWPSSCSSVRAESRVRLGFVSEGRDDRFGPTHRPGTNRNTADAALVREDRHVRRASHSDAGGDSCPGTTGVEGNAHQRIHEGVVSHELRQRE